MAVILKKITPEELCNKILSLDPHSIYCWGGNGEKLTAVTESWIEKHETTRANATIVISQWKKNKAYPEARLMDCSGLIVWALRELGVFSPTDDITANGLKGWCSQISKAQLQDGDFVFKVYQTEASAQKNGKHKGDAYHIGIYYKGHTYSSRGRKYNTPYKDETGWNWYGRPAKLYNAEPEAKGTPIKSALKKSSSYKIENVALQTALIECGFSCGPKKNNGYFGKDTYGAVIEFQKRYPECGTNGKPDGSAGKKTITKLSNMTKGILYWDGK